MTFVEVADDGAVRRVLLHDQERRNALSAAMLGEFMCALEVSSDIRVIIVSADDCHGVWSAGHDIGELPTGDRDPLTWDNPLEAALRAIRGTPVPVIAAVDGSVWGGACDLVFTCDLIVATIASTFAITPARLGIPYNTAGIAHFLSAVPVHVAKEMFFCADPIDATRAHALGVVNRLTETRAAMEQQSTSIAQRIVSRAPLAVAAIKAELNALTDARQLTSDEFEKLSGLRTRAWMSQDYREGLAAFRERREPDFEGR